MKTLSSFQHSFARFLIMVALYAMYIWFLFEAVELYFHPEKYILVVSLFITVTAFTFLFAKFMPKRAGLDIQVEVK